MLEQEPQEPPQPSSPQVLPEHPADTSSSSSFLLLSCLGYQPLQPKVVAAAAHGSAAPEGGRSKLW
ncbi:MAG: hypothetical protein R2853_16160 [Thermomicrobiales bacterium]